MSTRPVRALAGLALVCAAAATGLAAGTRAGWAIWANFAAPIDEPCQCGCSLTITDEDD